MKRVIILSQPLHNNYGGLLQAFALQRIVKSLGFQVVTDRIKLKPKRKTTIHKVLSYFINKIKTIAKIILGHNLMTPQKYMVISRNTQYFIDKFIDTVSIASLSESEVEKFDIFIVGSDQVFRKLYSPVTEYFLFALKDKKDKLKLAYAASFGTDDLSEWTDDDITICKTLAPKFKAISVREDSGVEIFNKVFNSDAEHVLDPTLLLEKKEYLKIIEEEDAVIRSNVLMCYVLDKTPEKSNIINQIKEKKNLNLLEIMPKEVFNKNTKEIERCVYPSVSKWIAGFRDADFVVTDSFHGTVFSIIFNKPFICIANKERGLTRFTSLLKIFNLENRLIFSSKDFSDTLLEDINYEKVNIIWKKWKDTSIMFLKDNLK